MLKCVFLSFAMTVGQSQPNAPPTSNYGTFALPTVIMQPPVPGAGRKTEGSKDGKDASKENGKDKDKEKKEDAPREVYGPVKTFFRGYPAMMTWFPNVFGKPDPVDPNAPEEPPAPRRGFPAPFMSPPFPSAEYQGAPVVGQPISGPNDQYPLTQALYAIQAYGFGDWMKDNRLRLYGWVNASTNWSSNANSNAPDSYWVRANRLELNQFVMKFEREADTVQTDHIDWGFRSCVLYGEDYRYTTAGGWGLTQLQNNNALYGWDPIEQYFDIYYPWFAQGVLFRVGRWVACPDIETQLAPDITWVPTRCCSPSIPTRRQASWPPSSSATSGLLSLASIAAMTWPRGTQERPHAGSSAFAGLRKTTTIPFSPV